jgi:hypothetical protein
MADFVHIEPGYRALLAAHGLDSVEGALAWQDGQRLDKPGLEPWRQRWRIRLTGGDARAETLYLKRFVAPPLARQWQRWREGILTHSTAHVEWRSAREMARYRIPATQVVAVGERMKACVEYASFICLKEVEGESLERIVGRSRTRPAGIGSPAIDALARFVARFHETGYVHRDLYLSHIFLLHSRSGTNERDYVLIDLQRVFRPRWRHRRWIVKDLAALACSTPPEWAGPSDRARFLLRYQRLRPDLRPAGRAARRHEYQRLALEITRREERMKKRVGLQPATACAPLGPRTDDPAASPL